MLQRQGPQAHKNLEMVPFANSPAATSRKKRTADVLDADKDGDDLVAHQPKVFRLHAFGGETAQAIGRMQLLQSQLAAQADPQGSSDGAHGAAGADVEMGMMDEDGNDHSSNDAAATLVDMLQRRGTVAARGEPPSPLQA